MGRSRWEGKERLGEEEGGETMASIKINEKDGI